MSGDNVRMSDELLPKSENAEASDGLEHVESRSLSCRCPKLGGIAPRPAQVLD